MRLDGLHMSTSLSSLEFEPIDGGTRFTHAEHDVFFDEFWADGSNRLEGTQGLLEALRATWPGGPSTLASGVSRCGRTSHDGRPTRHSLLDR